MSGPGSGPIRVIELILDDARFDDGYAVMTAGPRSGERVLEQCFTRIRDQAVRFRNCRTDLSYCGPSRASMQTGLYRTNHGIFNTSGRSYYQNARKGVHALREYDASHAMWNGPYEFDLAQKLGQQILSGSPSDPIGLALEAQTPVDPEDQGSVIGYFTSSSDRVRNSYNATTGAHDLTIGRGTVSGENVSGVTSIGDDLQAFTGCRATWLSPYLDRIMIFGKNQNGYGSTNSENGTPFNAADSNGVISVARTTRFIPPGYTDHCCYTVDDQDHTHGIVCEGFQLTNPGYGDGEIGTLNEYIYTWDVTALSWSAGEMTITATNPHNGIQADYDTTVAVGDEVALDGFGETNPWNFGYKNVTEIVSQSSSSVTVKVAMASDPGTVPADLTIGIFAPLKMALERVMLAKIIETLDTVSNDDSWLLQWGLRMPHASITADEDIGDELQNEKRYELNSGAGGPLRGSATDRNDAFYWENTNVGSTPWGGKCSPGVTAVSVTGGNRRNWAQRQNMLATADDVIGELLDYLDANYGPDGYIIFLMSDNGLQQGEQEFNLEDGAQVWAPVGGKIMVYDASERVFMWMRHPYYEEQNIDVACWNGDIALTSLEVFSRKFPAIVNHHAFTNRDGISLIELLDNLDNPEWEHNGRLVWGQGIYRQQNNDNGLYCIDSTDNMKVLRSLVAVLAPPNFDYQLFDMTPYAGWSDPDWNQYSGASQDFETDDLQVTYPTIADDLATALDTLMTAGWDPNLKVNTMRNVRR